MAVASSFQVIKIMNEIGRKIQNEHIWMTDLLRLLIAYVLLTSLIVKNHH